MAAKKLDNSQYDNFIEICKGYQKNEPDIQPKVSHPHLIQHSVAIILRVRPNSYTSSGSDFFGSKK